MIWDFFDDIICINLKSRPDRLVYARDIFQKLDIPVKFFIVEKNPKGGIVGCFDSHIQIVNYMKKTGKQNILIFEDDIYPTESYNIENIKNAINFMKTNKTWDLFYLGSFTVNYHELFLTTPVIYNNIVKYKPLSTHAYCINYRAVDKILSTYKYYIDLPINLDEYYAEYSDLICYCYIPILFNQHLCFPNDIEPRKTLVHHIARKYQCMFEKSNIFWIQSILKYYITSKVYLLITVIILVILVILVILKWGTKVLP